MGKDVVLLNLADLGIAPQALQCVKLALVFPENMCHNIYIVE